MTDLKGVIFDFNGVLLLDSHLQEKAWNECAWELRDRPLSADEMEHRIHGRTNADTLEYLVGRPMADEELLEAIAWKEKIYQQLCLKSKTEFRLAPGAVTFLDYLKAAHRPFTIATSSGISNLRFYYEHLSLENWFDFDTVAYDDGSIKGKPAPDLFIKAAKNLGLKPEQCIVIEDARSGITAAHRAGIGKIIAIGPHQNQRTLAAIEGVDKTITGFDDVLKKRDSLWTTKDR